MDDFNFLCSTLSATEHTFSQFTPSLRQPEAVSYCKRDYMCKVMDGKMKAYAKREILQGEEIPPPATG